MHCRNLQLNKCNNIGKTLSLFKKKHVNICSQLTNQGWMHCKLCIKNSIVEGVKCTSSFIDVFNLSSCLYEAENIQIC